MWFSRTFHSDGRTCALGYLKTLIGIMSKPFSVKVGSNTFVPEYAFLRYNIRISIREFEAIIRAIQKSIQVLYVKPAGVMNFEVLG